MFKCEQATVQEQTDPISAYGDISTMQSLDQKKNNKNGLCYNELMVRWVMWTHGDGVMMMNDNKDNNKDNDNKNTALV